MNVDDLQILQEKSYQFLVAAYMLSDDNWHSGLSFGEVLEYLGWQKGELDQVENFLRSRDLVIRLSSGPLGGTAVVTHNGIIEVERLTMNDMITVNLIDEKVSGESQKVNLKEKIQDKLMKRDEFLRRVYTATNGNHLQLVNIRPIAEAMGISEQEAYGLEQYLEGERWMQRHSSGDGRYGIVRMTNWGISQYQELLLRSVEKDTDVVVQKTRGPNADTVYKLEELRKLRVRNIRQGTVDVGWVNACQQIGIDTKTVNKHDPELRRRWDDPKYK